MKDLPVCDLEHMGGQSSNNQSTRISTRQIKGVLTWSRIPMVLKLNAELHLLFLSIAGNNQIIQITYRGQRISNRDFCY